MRLLVLLPFAVLTACHPNPESYAPDVSALPADSLYLVDNAPDCESEGFVRFRNTDSDKAGLFDLKGKVALEAGYDDLTRVMNGMLAGLTGAEKSFGGPEGCDHPVWSGGREVLLDTAGRILIDPFEWSDRLDFYSLRTDDTPGGDPERRYFTGTDGRTWSFIDYELEFREWLRSGLLAVLSSGGLKRFMDHRVACWKEPEGWVFIRRGRLAGRHGDLLAGILGGVKDGSAEYLVTMDGLNPFIHTGKDYRRYFNPCGEPMEWKYPVMSLIISRKTDQEEEQDQFDFLRTDAGYRLVGLSIASDSINQHL